MEGSARNLGKGFLNLSFYCHLLLLIYLGIKSLVGSSMKVVVVQVFGSLWVIPLCTNSVGCSGSGFLRLPTYHLEYWLLHVNRGKVIIQREINFSKQGYLFTKSFTVYLCNHHAVKFVQYVRVSCNV